MLHYFTNWTTNTITIHNTSNKTVIAFVYIPDEPSLTQFSTIYKAEPTKHLVCNFTLQKNKIYYIAIYSIDDESECALNKCCVNALINAGDCITITNDDIHAAISYPALSDKLLKWMA